ncbi:MAG: glycosyltransferase family 2 protein [Hyphomonadaceae bacterium]
MSDPELSVIVPTHEREALVARAVASALSQGVGVEVIVVDDGSPKPIAAFADERVKVVRLEQNRGAAAARNAGVLASRAPWIAFLDSDDIWPAGTLRPRFERAREQGGSANVIWAAGFTDIWPDGRQRARIPRQAATAEEFAAGCWFCPGSTALLSRAAWAASGGQDESLRRLEDYDWLLRWGLSGGRVNVFPAPSAEISRGGRASASAIAAAAARLKAKHSALSAALRGPMASYLCLEHSAALLHEGAVVRGLGALAKSWLLHPRLQPALERFWTPA